jgi:hypothetical protein
MAKVTWKSYQDRNGRKIKAHAFPNGYTGHEHAESVCGERFAVCVLLPAWGADECRRCRRVLASKFHLSDVWP